MRKRGIVLLVSALLVLPGCKIAQGDVAEAMSIEETAEQVVESSAETTILSESTIKDTNECDLNRILTGGLGDGWNIVDDQFTFVFSPDEGSWMQVINKRPTVNPIAEELESGDYETYQTADDTFPVIYMRYGGSEYATSRNYLFQIDGVAFRIATEVSIAPDEPEELSEDAISAYVAAADRIAAACCEYYYN